MNEQELQMNNVDKKKLHKVEKFLTDKDFSMYEEVSEIKDHLEGIHENLKIMAEKPEMEMPMHPDVQKMEVMGAEVITIKGIQGEVGATGEKGESIIGPIGPRGERGEKGPIGLSGIDGRDGESIVGPSGENGKDGSPDTYSQIRDKLESVENESEKLSIDAIKDLKSQLDDLRKKWTSRPMFGGSGFSKMALDQHIIDDETPTGAINDVNKDFIISHTPSPTSSLKVYLNGQRMRITEDYTFSGVTISFTNAPLTGSILLVDFRI